MKKVNSGKRVQVLLRTKLSYFVSVSYKAGIKRIQRVLNMSLIRAKKRFKREKYVFFCIKDLLFIISIILKMLYPLIFHLSSRHMQPIAHFTFSLRYPLHISKIIVILSISHFSNSHAPVFDSGWCYHPNCYIKCILNNYFSPLPTFPNNH